MPEMAVPVDVARLEALEAQATSGPWAFHAGDLWINASADELDRSNVDEEFANELWHGERPPPGSIFGGDPERVEDAEFIAAMRNAAPSLLAAYRERDELRTQIKRLERILDARRDMRGDRP